MQILLQFQRSNSNIDFNLFPVPVRNTGKIRLSLINMTNRMTYQLVSWNSNNTARYLILHPTTLLLRGFVITLVPQKRVCPKVPSRGYKARKKKTIKYIHITDLKCHKVNQSRFWRRSPKFVLQPIEAASSCFVFEGVVKGFFAEKVQHK